MHGHTKVNTQVQLTFDLDHQILERGSECLLQGVDLLLQLLLQLLLELLQCGVAGRLEPTKPLFLLLLGLGLLLQSQLQLLLGVSQSGASLGQQVARRLHLGLACLLQTSAVLGQVLLQLLLQASAVLVQLLVDVLEDSSLELGLLVGGILGGLVKLLAGKVDTCMREPWSC